MYSKQEESLLRKQFWTSFGQYLAPIPSATGLKINWINYKTGIRHVQFKMDAVNEQAYIGVELSHNDPTAQQLFFNHFKTLQQELENTIGEKWLWEEHTVVNGKSICRIYQVMNNINIYRQADWPEIISFLKTRIIGLDRFWAAHKDIFEMLS